MKKSKPIKQAFDTMYIRSAQGYLAYNETISKKYKDTYTLYVFWDSIKSI